MEKLSHKELAIADVFGGADLESYDGRDELPSCDKGGHKMRSIVISPAHKKHWKKDRKIPIHLK